ncbi:MAG: HAD-IIIA family hydrolase [Cardiobacteriaceae bacterium]|nr:HAD-IIIA family hydrolase [Cardiobacteriaceae bacterium]
MIDLGKRLVLLDRDGVINEDRGDFVTHPDELRLLSSALRAIARLTAAGIRVGVCTNQSGIARGRLDEAMLARIHGKLLEAVEHFGGHIARIVHCPSGDAAHPWRKPNPGMLLDQADFFQTDLVGVPFVGDNLVDLDAARAAGAQPVLVKTGKGARTFRHHRKTLTDVAVYPNLEEAVREWLA